MKATQHINLTQIRLISARNFKLSLRTCGTERVKDFGVRTNHTLSVGNGNAIKVMNKMQIINILKETIFLSNLFENTILGFTLTNYLPRSKKISKIKTNSKI